MTALSRQSALFVSEDWKKVYESLVDVDFTAYDQKTLRSVLLDNIKSNYPDEFNDWIQSSEFVIKLDTLCFLVQSLAYRFDMNTRENILKGAERRQAVLNLVSNITYPISRLQAASGELKIVSVRTNQPLLDLDDNSLANKTIKWNDPIDTEWFDKWLIVMGSAFDPRTKWGKPLRRYIESDNEASLYRLNSPSPPTGIYSFNSTIGNVNLPFNIINAMLDEKIGNYSELSPNSDNNYHLLYRNDSLGSASVGNGFFLPIKQGQMSFKDFKFSSLEALQIININTPNINNRDVWVSKIDDVGNVLEEWTQTDNVLNESLSYNSVSSKKIFEVITKDNDQVAIRFGDGKFGQIPQGIFRVWYRTSSPTAYLIKSSDIQSQRVTIQYVANSQVWNLTLELSLQESISNAAETESLEEIKQKASRVYYTQNRMVNGEDYNNFPLTDNSILKVKSVNRTFAGKSKNLNVKDNTGAYDNVSLYGDDGRLYKEYKTTTSQFTYNPRLQSLDTFIDQNITGLFNSKEKQIFYYNNFSPVFYNQDLFFTVDSTVDGRTKGHLSVSPNSNIYFKPNSILYFANGETARLDYIVSGTTGTETDTVILKRNIVLQEEYINKIMPPLRGTITNTEKTLINERLSLKKSFGVRWDFTSQSYAIIKAENISTGEFNLDTTGDTSSTNADSTWFIRLEYNYSQNGEDFWTVYQRGLYYVFESEGDVNFIHVNDKAVVDYKSGKQLRDTITLLPDNETKLSLPRRGVRTSLGGDPYSGRIVITGNGVQTNFEIETDMMSSAHIFFEVDNEVVQRSGWELKASTGKYFIKFNEPLELGEIVTIVYDNRKINMVPQRLNYLADGLTDTFGLSRQNNKTENSFIFENNLIKECFDHYKIFQTSIEDRVKFTYVPENEENISILSFSGGEPIFNTYSFVGDGIETEYLLRTSSDFIMVFVAGLLVSNYTINTEVEESDRIVFASPPTAGATIHIKALLKSNLVRVDSVTYTATNGQSQFTLPATAGKLERTLTFLNGYFQHAASVDEEINKVILSAACAGGESIKIFHFTVLASNSLSYDIITQSARPASPTFLGQDWKFLVYDQARYTDGYTNTKAVLITNVDEDLNGEIDNPEDFGKLVLEDGLSDLVLWRKITENGFDIWSAISENSSPRGTYHSKLYTYQEGDALTDEIGDGWIHYDYRNDTWYVADTLSGEWIEAPVQNDYKFEIGRNRLKFKWDHYTSSEQQINPSSSNINDMYVLTKEYDRAVRQWIIADDKSDIPDPPSLTTLKTQYSYLLNHKTVSDTVLWNPAKYKVLFGPQALSELQCKFLVVKTVGSNIPSNDLKLKILNVINEYFNIDLWDFGDKFYFTELAAYVHSKLATYVQTFVPVSLSGEPFGRLFEIRCEPNEIFLNTATPTQIEVVDSLTDARLNIRF